MRGGDRIAIPDRGVPSAWGSGRPMHIIPGHEGGKNQKGHADLDRRLTQKPPARAPHTVYPNFLNGIIRSRSPVAWKMALPIAGAIAGNAGSPMPVGGKSDWMK